ncbi:two-component system chemotaxis response regulator CheY [Amaricoccus macauensis]|jgi:two-component system chemotaxis response regulator CheY|uniref:Two-component system chemotaxis response regulator CheY n=1 Tax=Amaricoccus macauensis TaxID=57001 RepID=A0A840SL88_9RHOB|nr:response regulator [Amaricoccus macauensis]MBB5220233.1 two-component system chemotaxis response regulator CheY [Amaricoccus macauensis]
MPAARTVAALVVDDQHSMRAMARLVLKEIGVIDVAVAASADAAFEQMLGRRFDVVISDLNMPGTSGAELAVRIKAHPELCRVPVFLATSNAYRDQAGAAIDRFVAKPFVVGELREALEAHLGALS